MLCQSCQEEEATMHLTKIINNQKKEIYLCKKCAQEKGELAFSAPSFSFNNLLAGLLNNEFTSKSTGSSLGLGYQEQKECENCGLNYKEFSNSGRLGCNECYLEFGNWTERLLKKIHGSNRHNGKVPQRTGGLIKVKKEIQDLRKQMQAAVEKEKFEEAAKLRDKIKELEAELE
ncbi:UvrB/UvrC motif-containing protein [Fuchsiella alkaliacetigena]|uniref:UvrB/UvrC motif-containing protein n=1 Tax=Fuchsiella alkaliacetigena TaxID=957042 RepID=UPI00200A6AF1|nr:UvrB/UvrC motif-containing protein [Fuchsiella alkaliacetigena]MCK8825820.1 UvrB/UvrC motif-containing protein [Fuchsiella alkaliacetigena]